MTRTILTAFRRQHPRDVALGFLGWCLIAAGSLLPLWWS